MYNFKTLMKEIKADLNKWRYIPSLWTRRFIILKTSILPDFIYIHTHQLKSSKLFVNINKLILKFKWRSKRPRIANTVLEGKNEVEGLILPDFKMHWEAKGISGIDESTEQCSRIESRNIINWPLTKKQTQSNGERIIFSRNSAGTTGYSHLKNLI